MYDSDDSARRSGAPVSTRLMMALMMTMAGATSIGCGDDEDADGDTDAAVIVDAGRDSRVPDDDEDEDSSTVEEDSGEVVDEEDAGEVEEDAGEVDIDAGLEGDAGEGDAGSDATVDAGPAALANERLWTTGLSPARADRFNAVAFSRDSQKIYAAGYVTDIVLPATTPPVFDRKFAVAAFNLDGTIDTTFGGNGDGIAKVNLVAATATVAEEIEQAKGIAVQTGGQIVAVGTFRKSSTARDFPTTLPDGGVGTPITYTEDDIDSVVVRFTAAGTLDTSFGAGDADGRDGLVIRSLSAPGVTLNAAGTGVTQTNEDLPGVAIDSQNRIVLFSAARVTSRFDNDRVLLRLTPTGAQDTTFGTLASNYAYAYSSPGSFSENAKAGVILADDGIISPGYTNIGGFNNVVVARATASGAAVAGWGNESSGITINPFANTTTPAASGLVEAYSAALQSTGHFVTTGYGRVETVPGGTNPTTSLLSLRFNSNGQLDTAWGNRGGYTQIDTLNGETTASAGVEQGRTAVALPDDRILMGGNGTPGANATNGNAGDAIAVLLRPNGQLDTGFFTYGSKSYNLGGTNDAFYGSAISPNGDYAVLAGYSTTAGTLTSDNAALVIYQIGE